MVSIVIYQLFRNVKSFNQMKAVYYLVSGFLFLAVVSSVPSYGQKKSKSNIITGYVVDVNLYPVINATEL